MDTISWDILNVLKRFCPKSWFSPCDFRYDKKRNIIYRIQTISEDQAKITYIAKAEGMDIYKVGCTKNLSQRINGLRNKKPYSLLNLKPIAYCPDNIESAIKRSIGFRNAELPHPFEKSTELMFLAQEDVDKLITECGFTRIVGDELPKAKSYSYKICYDPKTGRCIKVERIYDRDEQSSESSNPV